MSDERTSTSQDHSADRVAEGFYNRAYFRVLRFMLSALLIAVGPLALKFGRQLVLGFVFGSLIAFVNLHWLERTITSLADLAIQTPGKSRAGLVVSRFLLRYFLIALGGYAIFRASLPGFYGLLVGLFLPLAGIFCEAIYEFWFALQRES